MLAVKHLLTRAVSLKNAGKHEDARRLLLWVLHQDPGNQSAWLHYAETFPDTAERDRIYEQALTFHPQMQLIRRRRHHSKQSSTAEQLYEEDFERAASTNHTEPNLIEPWTAARNLTRFRWLVVAAAMLVLAITAFTALGSSAVLEGQLIQTRRELSQAKSRLAESYGALSQLTQDHLKLKLDYDTAARAYQNLSAQHQELEQHYKAVHAENTDLKFQLVELDQRHKALQDSHASMERQYADLSSKAVLPPYIMIAGRQVHLAFYKTDGSLMNWEVPVQVLEQNIERGVENRKSMDLLRLSGSNGSRYRVPDYRKFIDTSGLTGVMRDLYNQSASPEAFIREVWYITSQLTQYESDPGEDLPRYPLETLLAGGGDCEDTTILFASMVRAARPNWKISLVYINMEYPTLPLNPDHVLVSVDTGSMVQLVETTNPEVMDPYGDGLTGWYFEVP